MNLHDLPPHAVVLDLVLRWSDKIGRVGTAKLNGHSLIVTAQNHRDEFVMATVEINLEGKASIDPPRFVFFKIGPGVWKLAPSIKHDKLHAYITVVDVPEPAPWSRA